jgi:hypothetical protein
LDVKKVAGFHSAALSDIVFWYRLRVLIGTAMVEGLSKNTLSSFEPRFWMDLLETVQKIFVDSTVNFEVGCA